MNNLITLDQAKEQLRIVDTNDDTYITGLVSAASAVIVSYLKTPVAAAYDVTTDSTSATYPPMHVQQATLLVLAYGYRVGRVRECMGRSPTTQWKGTPRRGRDCRNGKRIYPYSFPAGRAVRRPGSVPRSGVSRLLSARQCRLARVHRHRVYGE
jgi:hypothetical protein